MKRVIIITVMAMLGLGWNSYAQTPLDAAGQAEVKRRVEEARRQAAEAAKRKAEEERIEAEQKAEAAKKAAEE